MSRSRPPVARRTTTVVGAVAGAIAVAFALWNFFGTTAPGPQPGTPQATGQVAAGGAGIALAELPSSAQETVELIKEGGPFPYRQDGSTFGNREGLLPDQPHGYYREYTVEKPGSADRGPWRIVTGGDGPESLWWTPDHYQSFSRIDP